MKKNEVLLQVSELATYFFTPYGEVKAVDGVTFTVRKGETLGIIGESGSGKSVTALSIMKIIPKGGRIVSGRILLECNDLLKSSEEEMRRYRGKVISMIFQNPRATLDPYFKIKTQLAEQLRAHDSSIPSDAVERNVLSILDVVRIDDAKRLIDAYPSQLSTGMCQRIMIAMALLCKPKIVIADEPTSNLDLLTQYHILSMLKKLKKEENLSMIFITHDFAVVSFIADRIAVMYGGKIMEMAEKEDILTNPTHPYTYGLVNSVLTDSSIKKRRLYQIKGRPPNNLNPPPGCRFAQRCERVRKICRELDPSLREIKEGHYVRCHFAS